MGRPFLPAGLSVVVLLKILPGDNCGDAYGNDGHLSFLPSRELFHASLRLFLGLAKTCVALQIWKLQFSICLFKPVHFVLLQANSSKKPLCPLCNKNFPLFTRMTALQSMHCGLNFESVLTVGVKA